MHCGMQKSLSCSWVCPRGILTTWDFYITSGGMKHIQAAWKFNQLANGRIRIWSQVGSLNTKAFTGSRSGLCLMRFLDASSECSESPHCWQDFCRTVLGLLACTWISDCFLTLNIYVLGAVIWHRGLNWWPWGLSMWQDVRLHLKWVPELFLNKTIPPKALKCGNQIFAHDCQSSTMGLWYDWVDIPVLE